MNESIQILNSFYARLLKLSGIQVLRFVYLSKVMLNILIWMGKKKLNPMLMVMNMLIRVDLIHDRKSIHYIFVS